MLKTLNKYKAPYLFILPFFSVVSCIPADPRHLDLLHQPYQLEGDRDAEVLRVWQL